MNPAKQQPSIKARKTTDLYFSPIWILPLLALIIVIWLSLKLFIESKIPITIEMTSAEGIVKGKTRLKFRGIHGGLVTKIEISDDLSYVIVHADMDPSIEPYLTSATQFWVVRAQISLAGVSGLETVLSGDYIAMQPSAHGISTRHFRALKSAPPIGEDDPGLRITLQAEKLGSISEGSRLFYRQIPIGEVRYFQLSEDSKSVKINALIEERYADLVNQSTVFWNSGGIRLKGSLTGFEIQTESLSSLLAGGISLFTPDNEALPIVGTAPFVLYDDYDSAGVGVTINIHFPSGYDLKPGITSVRYQGLKIGHLIKIISDSENRGVVAKVVMDPSAETFLRKDTEFWLVKPNLSLSNISNLDTLVSGKYITLKVGMSEGSSRDFTALDGPPPPDFSEPGLHIYLTAKVMGSLSIGTPILFKGVEVGRIANILAGDLSNGIGLHLQIRPEYSQLINNSTRFWNVSGLEISLGLGGLKVRSESVMSILRGGIAFDTPLVDAAVIKNGHKFYLLDSQEASENKMTVLLYMESAELLEPGFTQLKYKGFEAGTLRKVTYDSHNNQVVAELGIDPRFENILRKKSVFWLVKPQIKASKIEGIDALLGGVYFAVQPGEGEPQHEFNLASMAPALDWSSAGVHLLLHGETASSLQVGSGVYYQNILVGSVQSVRLNKHKPGVIIQIHVRPEYADRVQSHSQFYNMSGLSIKASLSGISIETGSLDSLIAGGVAFHTASNISSSIRVKNGEIFTLHKSKEKAAQQGFTIVLDLTNASSVSEGTKITYKGIQVGEVRKSRLNLEEKSVQLTVSMQKEVRDLIRDGSSFWLAKTQLGLLRQENLGAILSGPELRLLPGDGEHKNNFTILNHQPVVKNLSSGLNLILESPLLGSVTRGVPVYYRQITVGEVLGHELAKSSDKVLIYINIYQRYKHLVRENSRFWNASGFAIEAGILSGLQIKAESLETMIAGGVSFATPDKPDREVTSGYRFKLSNEMGANWDKWRPIILLE